MASLLDHPSSSVAKMIIAADSGSGKTGGLASLVDAGYNVRILDFDEGVSTIRGYVRDKSKLGNVRYIPLRDKLTLMGDKLGIKSAIGFKRGMEALELKTELWGEPKLPPISQWTSNDVLVLDSLTMAGRSCLYLVMSVAGAMAKNPEIQHYGVAMDNIEKLLGQLTTEEVPCNVIVNTHIAPQREGSTKLYPDALGDKLGPKIGRYFDNMITLGTIGGKRVYKTRQDGAFQCKTAVPMADTYPLETGLADIFKKLKEG